MKTRILNLCGVASLLGFAVILGGRWFYVLLFAALLVWNLAGKRWGWAVTDLALAAVCFVCLLPWLPPWRAVTALHFQLWEGQYQATAQQLTEDILVDDALSNCQWEDKRAVPWYLSLGGEVDYLRHEERVVIQFVVNDENVAGYAYVPDADSYELLCNVRDYWPDSSLENTAEYPQLAEQWVYLSIY